MEIFGLAALGLIGGELLKYGKITSGPRALCIWCSSSSADNVMTAAAGPRVRSWTLLRVGVHV